ncbi:hypothetical protein [Rhodococcus sp. NBC_00294]|uniref:hypothetical protein n=1 Tax=Rhodococcus sp. NBC_00294 TaxID=2976004 RepID=UPI002E2E60AC|nr:hypothetical protein [Rhodococcus sp. NBC_00294]
MPDDDRTLADNPANTYNGGFFVHTGARGLLGPSPRSFGTFIVARNDLKSTACSPESTVPGIASTADAGRLYYSSGPSAKSHRRNSVLQLRWIVRRRSFWLLLRQAILSVWDNEVRAEQLENSQRCHGVGWVRKGLRIP